MKNNIHYFGHSFYFNDKLFVYLKIGEDRWWKTIDGSFVFQGGYFNSIENDKNFIINEVKIWFNTHQCL